MFAEYFLPLCSEFYYHQRIMTEINWIIKNPVLLLDFPQCGCIQTWEDTQSVPKVILVLMFMF